MIHTPYTTKKNKTRTFQVRGSQASWNRRPYDLNFGATLVNLWMTAQFRIRRASNDPKTVDALANVLIDCVAGGASVNFMHPMPRSKAITFWQNVLDSAMRGERVVLVAEDSSTGRAVGTVQVVPAPQDNQQHRADIAKMLVHRSARRRGLGAELMRAAEATARELGKTLLVLDTAAGGDAERLYARLGWQRLGTIPGYALFPDGEMCDATFFYRSLTATQETRS
jgi:GNAT superfamily N-acetyltransferase